MRNKRCSKGFCAAVGVYCNIRVYMHTYIFSTLCLMFCALLLTGPALPDISVAADLSTKNKTGLFHREYPADPPALSSQWPRNRTGARTPAAKVQQGPFVSIQVNLDEFGNNILGDAANEPSIAIDPTNPAKIVIGWRQFDTVASNFRQAGWAYSHDRGQTWTFPGVLDPGVFRSDPVLDSDADGNIYYYSLTQNDNDGFTCDLFISIDNGVSWQEPIFAFGGDKPWMALDKTNGIGQGNIYALWQPLSNNYGRRTFTCSTDGGLTFVDPKALPRVPAFGTIAVGPDSKIYAAGIMLPFLGMFLVAKSASSFVPQANPDFATTLVNMGGRLGFTRGLTERPNPEGLLGQVWVAVDLSGGPTRGNVYVLASVDPPGGDPLDVHFIRSTNAGATWSKPVRINDDPLDSHAWQWFGTLSVAPNGRIDIVWNDTRNTGRVNLSELYYSYSQDAGKTWSPNIAVGPVFDSHVGWPNQKKIGDYYHMISDNGTANLAYAATFNGEQDVYFLQLGDCNSNGIHDSRDISAGTSRDLNTDSVPDECDAPPHACGGIPVIKID